MIISRSILIRGPGVAQWFRHCATSRKVPGSILGVARVSSVASDSSMCPGVDWATKNEYQVKPGGKGGRCVRPITLPPSCADVKKFGGLNLLEPCGPVQTCNGTALQILIRMRNVTDKSYRENHNTYFMFNVLFFENRALWEKNGKIQ
jgi:hypothetical protein